MKTSDLIGIVRDRFSDGVFSSHSYRGDDTLVINPAILFEVAQFLRDSPKLRMNFLMDLTAVDYLTFGKGPRRAFFASSGVAVRPSQEIPDEDPWPGPPADTRFVVIYHFYSLEHRHRLRLAVPAPGKEPEVESLTTLWAGASWLEREVWDMFGIRFRGHPNLTRILMYEEFEGHPLRKDYPVNKRQPLVDPINQ